MDCAILPKKVLSPVACTKHVAFPFRTVVPKKAKLRASVGGCDSFSVFECRGSGIDSPVRALLSTSMPSVQYRMRTSAGMRSPASKKMISPGTRCSTSFSTSVRFPSSARRTQRTGLSPCIFCIASIASSASISVYHCNMAVATMMTERRMGVTMSSPPASSSSITVSLKPGEPGLMPASARTSCLLSSKAKRRMVIARTHIHSKMLKMPQKAIRRSLIHLFSFWGGVILFGP
mmetsp:Transcript_93780/g.195597  ORF Transcript_93780/g.195597 Transcript_93780/m.195597 type:complete len:233 (-) Transcript_93780:355-1053(-)